MLVERELAIRDFVPEDYLEVVATFSPRGTPAAYVPGHLVSRPRARSRQGIAAASMRLPADGEEAGRIVARARTGRGRASRSIDAADPAHAAAAALRSDRAAAPRQPPLRLQRAEDARPGAGALRTAQADQLSAHRQPPPLAGRGRDAAAHRARDRRRPTASCSRPAPASARSAGASWTTPRSPTTTPSSPPPPRPASASLSRRRAARSTTWSAGACSAPGTTTTSGPSPPSSPPSRNAGDRSDRYHTSRHARCSRQGWKVLDIVRREGEEGAEPAARTRRASRRCRPDLAAGQPQDVLDAEARARRRPARPSASPRRRC